MFFCAYIAPQTAIGDTADCSNQTVEFVPLVCYSNSQKFSGLYSDTGGNLGTFVNHMFFFAISVGGILAVARLVWAGYEYMASDLWTNKNKAKEIIKDTLLGVVLLIAVYLILNQINPQLLNLSVLPQSGG